MKHTSLLCLTTPYVCLPALVKPSGAPFTLPTLRFDIAEGLSPVLSQKQLDLHYNKHHRAYVDKLNSLLPASGNSKYDDQPIEKIIRDVSPGVLYNQAAQHFNHSFYWQCLTPAGRSLPNGSLKAAIERSFPTLDQFQSTFNDMGMANFGSGWTWLVVNPESKVLSVVNTSNAQITETNVRPILTVDVWEHAYYKDFENRRAEYLKEIWKIIDWVQISENYERAMSESSI